MLLLFCYFYHKYFFINLNILNVDVFSPAGNHTRNYLFLLYLLLLTSKPQT